jgi:transcriptional regulator with XRE-family HTH domain
MVLRDRQLKQKLATFAGVTENTIYEWLRTDSRSIFRIDLLEAISQETGIAVEDLITRVPAEV